MLALFVGGCGRSPSHPGPLAVAGTVNLDDKPISYARIAFAPDWSTEFSTTANVVDGHFEIGAREGLRPGRYAVCILPYEPEAEEIAAAIAEGRPSPVKARKLVPLEYQQRGVLSAEVTSETANGLIFELQSPKSKRE